jgi:indolepyruvate ferredoxin oxidoreductase
MAYKDEYEVARLYAAPEFLDRLRRQFDGDYRVEFHLAAPLLARRDPASGEMRKRALGGWMLRVFALLARFKWLRGTPFDPFGRTADRRLERSLIREYEALLAELLARLSPENHARAIELAALPERIRGFGHVKQHSAAEVKRREADLLAEFRARGADVMTS